MAAAIPVVWWFTRNPGETQRQLPFRRMAVARLGGKEFQPAISPDGAKIAFVLEREDGTPDRIWLRSGQTPPGTIEREGWQCLSPAWSPDGKSLAYLRLSGDEGQVMIASAATGKDERVVTGVFRTRYGLPNHHLDWSPDGKTLAFDDTSAPEKPFAISIISLETGNRMQLTTPPSNALGDVEPRFSPDGSKLSFIRVFHRARQGLFTIEIKNRKLRQLTRDGFQISGQDWLPDGKSIVMGSNRSGDFRLRRVRAGDSGAELVPDWTGTYGDAALQLSIARRAPVLVYSVLQEDFNIWRLSLHARDDGPDRWTRVVNSSAQDVSPQYSPDGTQICFRSDRTGEEQLWISSADGSNPRQVTRGDLRPSVGRWAPNGKAIVFNDSKEQDLYITRLSDDGFWRVIPLEAKGIHPVFASDAKWIYAGYSGNIIRVSVEGGHPTVVSKTKGLSFGLSDDANSLYFVRELTDSALCRLSLATGEVSKVLEGLVPYCTSCWAAGPDGVYYLAAKRPSVNGQAIYFHAYNGGPDKMIAEYPEPLLPLGSGPFSLSPDGKYLLCVRVDPSNADVIRIEPYR
jgi:Tol biopolymer transport system component